MISVFSNLYMLCPVLSPFVVLTFFQHITMLYLLSLYLFFPQISQLTFSLQVYSNIPIGPSLIILHKTGIHLSTYHSLSLHYCFHSIEHHVICELLTFKNKQKKNLCPFTRMKFHDNKGIAISPVSKLGLGLCRHLKHLS